MIKVFCLFVLFWFCRKLPNSLPKGLYSFAFPTAMNESFCYSTSSPAFGVVSVLDLALLILLVFSLYMIWIVLWNLNLRWQKNHLSYGSQSDPHLLAESSTNSSNTSGSPQRLAPENSQTDLVKYWEQVPPFLQPLALNMLHPARTTVFYQALSTSVPWSFKAKKPVPGSVGERREMSLQRQCLSPLFLVTLSVGSRALMGGPQYLTAFLEPKNNPQTRDGANPEKSTLHSGHLSPLDDQGFEGA